MKIGDKVRSSYSLWKDVAGTISGIIKRENHEQGDWVHVIFPETEKHYAFRQSFNQKDLVIIENKL